MVTTGWNDARLASTEIVDLSIKGDNKCNWPDFPKSVASATGGLVGNTVIICGGKFSLENSDECYSLNGEGVTFVAHMSIKRRFAASVVLHDTILWVTGGFSDYNPV